MEYRYNDVNDSTLNLVKLWDIHKEYLVVELFFDHLQLSSKSNDFKY